MHTYYEAGLFSQKLALGYDLIAAELSKAEMEQIAAAFRKNVIEPTVDEYFRYDRMPLAASNWMANSVGGALMAAVATQGDVDGWIDREGPSLAQLAVVYARCLRALFRGDDAQMEPLGYQHFAMQGFSWGAAALASVGVRPVELTRMYSAFRWPKYAMVRPNLMLDGGDFNGEFRTFDGFAYGAENGRVPGLRAFYDQRPKRDPSLLDLICCTGNADAGETAPLSRIFGDRGSAVFRSGWASDATVISLRAGPWFNHEHHDQGSFQLAAFGDQVIAEAGYASYYRDPNYPTYFTQAPGHNTVLIDDDAFSQVDSSGGFWPALKGHLSRISSHLLSADFDYVEANLAGAYDGRLSGYTRRFLYLRPDVLVVADDVRTPEAHTFSWLLHAADGTIPVVSGERVRIETTAAVADILGGGKWEMSTTPLPISLFSDLSRGVIRDRYMLRQRSARARHAEFTTAIHVRARGAAEPAISRLGSGFEDARAGWCALVRSGADAIRHRGYVTDARMFAVRGEKWFAAEAQKLEHGSEVSFTASSPVNIASNGAGEFEVYVPASATIEIRTPAGHLSRTLSQGEHRVRILDGKSL
jgi:hypothetical protein